MDSTTEDGDSSFKAPPPKKSINPDLNYEEPEWSGAPPSDTVKYELEVLKNGVIIESYPLSGKNFFVLGRLPTVDIPQEHPSLSRHHAIIQYRPGSGFFLFDLDSAHGTFHNKRRVIPRTYVPLRVGHSIKLAGSTRLLLLQGPEEDSEPEIPMEVVKERIAQKKAEKEAEERKEDEQGISWGMREDAVEETEGINLSNIESETPLDLDDPKKTLRNWFEREGYELDYKVEEKGHSSFICSIDLPTETGEPLIAEVKAGKKKESIIQCALEACRMLDRRGLLRTSSASSKRKNMSKNWEEMDYYDSDDDEFLDRTGNIQEKRLKRMKLANKSAETVDTHDSLKEKLALVESERAKVQSELDKSKSNVGSEDLDDYINSLNGGAVDKHTIDKLKTKLHELKRESMRLSKLIELTKPSDVTVSVSKESTKKFLPGGVMIGKRCRVGMISKTRMIPVPKKEQKDDSKTGEDKEKIKVPKEDLVTESKPDLQQASTDNNKSSEKSTESKEKMSLPPIDNSSKTEKSIEKEDAKKKKKSQSKQQSDPKKQENISICDEGKIEGNYSSSLSDPKYATWVPPANQTGDGRTSLNDKYGY